MRKYPLYKKANVDWLDDIPVNWATSRLKMFSKIYSGGTPDKNNKEFWENGTIPWIASGEVNQEIISFPTTYITEEAFLNSSAKWIPENALVLALAGQGRTKGTVAVLGIETTCNQSLAAIIIKRIHFKYVFYWLKSKYQDIRGLVGEDRDGLNLPLIGNINIPIPTQSEQNSIVVFLDYKTAQIDIFIANRQKQIELLKEQLQKKILTALSKGISNREFKKTNLPWFPEIPVNWEITRFNAAIKLLHGFQFRENHFKEDGVKVVKITQLKADGTLDLSEASYVDEKCLTTFPNKIIRTGDILMALTGGTIGKIICVDNLKEEVLQNYRVGKFIPKDIRNLDKEYMFWVLSSEFTYAQILFLQRETGQPNIGIGDFSKMFFPMPDSLNEQIEISKFIAKQKSETETIITKYQRQIELMQEYRTSLISQAVTGKIDVRDWKPKK